MFHVERYCKILERFKFDVYSFLHLAFAGVYISGRDPHRYYSLKEVIIKRNNS